MTSDGEQPAGENPPAGEQYQTMEALLEAEPISYPRLRRGEIIEGLVVGSDREGILVDIGAKSEGIIPPQEMHCLRPIGPSQLKEGERVIAFVLQPETPDGQIILSLDRARGEKGWRVLQEYSDQGKVIEASVSGYNKGGLLVTVKGVNAFVPLSQIVSERPDRASPEATEQALASWVGRTILLKVIELNRRRNRAILSERAALQEKRAIQKEHLLEELKEGNVKRGRITSIRDFGVFVDVGGADGLVHLSELSWERTPKSPHEMFRVGQEVDVYVMRVDQQAKKIALSVRRAQPEQWEDTASNYRTGQTVTGQVTKLATFGAFVRLDGPIEGLIHISELADRRIGHPEEIVREGDLVPVKIVRIEHDRHRLGLSLRQAREVAEDEGWRFNDDGGVAEAPPEARVGALAKETTATEEATTAEQPTAANDAIAKETTTTEEATTTEQPTAANDAIAEETTNTEEATTTEQPTAAVGAIAEETTTTEEATTTEQPTAAVGAIAEGTTATAQPEQDQADENEREE